MNGQYVAIDGQCKAVNDQYVAIDGQCKAVNGWSVCGSTQSVCGQHVANGWFIRKWQCVAVDGSGGWSVCGSLVVFGQCVSIGGHSLATARGGGWGVGDST